MKTYTIIGGVNGVGKSSLTGVLRQTQADLGMIVDVDRITASLGGNALAGGREAIHRIEQYLAKGISFTQETTLSGLRTERTAQRARELGYCVRLHYVGLDTAEESIARIANRVRRGGHNIASEDVQRRFSERWEAVARILPYCESASFYDNDNGFICVAEYRNGQLQCLGSYRPHWICELEAYLRGVTAC